jgi:hypothetical protein
METHAAATADSLTGKHSFRSGYLRAACCIAVALVAFWYPNCSRWLTKDSDPRLGFFACFGLIAITGTAYRATDTLCCAYEDAAAPTKRKRLPMVAGLVLICWLPIILWVLSVAWAMIGAYVR